MRLRSLSICHSLSIYVNCLDWLYVYSSQLRQRFLSTVVRQSIHTSSLVGRLCDGTLTKSATRLVTPPTARAYVNSAVQCSAICFAGHCENHDYNTPKSGGVPSFDWERPREFSSDLTIRLATLHTKESRLILPGRGTDTLKRIG